MSDNASLWYTPVNIKQGAKVDLTVNAKDALTKMIGAVIFAVQEEERRKAAAARLKRKGGKLMLQAAAPE